jgi:hypothetical protein
VVVHSDRVYGRKPVIRLVRELMVREEVGGSLRNQRFPILVVEGFRGAGKTALLSALVELLDQRVPHARLDFEANRSASIPQVLSALAFELSRKCRRYGVLQFPRFIVGQLVMGLELDLTDRAQARSQVREALERQRGIDTLRNVLVKTAGDVLKTIYRGSGLPVEPPHDVLSLILKWLTARAPGRFVLGSFQDWYGHRDLGLHNDSVDVLVDLNRWAGNAEDEDSQQRVDDLLWAAFLADLRAEFDRGRRADERSLNGVVLLDNADTVLGRRFLNELVRARRQRVAGGLGDADPLTVVATSRGTLLAKVPSADRALVPPYDARSGQLPRTKDGARPWWLQYRLPDLTDDEVGWAVATLALDRGNNQRLTQVVFQLTGGHPASTSLVLGAIAKSPPRNRIEPEMILDQVLAGEGSPGPPTVEDQILSHLLAGVSDATLRDLVTCSAAREQRHALALAVQDDLLVGGQANYVEVLAPILWPPDDAAGPALLRRLLRRRLALRSPAVSSNWAAVYARLRDVSRAEDDEAGELYYALAGGELRFVTQRLHQRIAELENKPWFELLESVTAAPRRHRHRQAPVDEVHTLVNEAALEQPLTSLARLIAALWIGADPFSHSDRRELHLQIAAYCTEVARLSPNGSSTVLQNASDSHRTKAERWG